jgi:hypothetical protein
MLSGIRPINPIVLFLSSVDAMAGPMINLFQKEKRKEKKESALNLEHVFESPTFFVTYIPNSTIKSHIPTAIVVVASPNL